MIVFWTEGRRVVILHVVLRIIYNLNVSGTVDNVND